MEPPQKSGIRTHLDGIFFSFFFSRNNLFGGRKPADDAIPCKLCRHSVNQRHWRLPVCTTMVGWALFICGRPTCPQWEALMPPLWRCQWGAKQRPLPFRQCFLEVLNLIVCRADGHVSETISRRTDQQDSHTPGQQWAVVNQTSEQHVIKKAAIRMASSHVSDRWRDGAAIPNYKSQKNWSGSPAKLWKNKGFVFSCKKMVV